MVSTRSIAKVAVLLLFSMSAQAAPVVPDAGQTSRELQQQPELIPQQSTEPLPSESEAPRKSGADVRARVAVTAVRITGSSAFKAGELEALVADLAGGERSLAELGAGADRITAYYRSHGYLVARAYLPAQDIKDGVVTIAVLEGRLGEQLIRNQTRLSDERINSYLDVIKRGEVLQAKTANRALLLLRDTPGVGGATASLQPGASVGTSDLIVNLTPSAPYSANIELDNHGNRYTGENRLGADLMINNPLKMGDQISVSVLTTDQHLSYARLAYQVPAGSSGLRVGGTYSSTRYRLGKEFAMLQAHGRANNTSLYALYPFIRSQSGNLTGMVGWEHKELSDSTDAPVTSSDKSVQLVNLGMAGNRTDARGGGGITTIEVSLASGKLDMDAASLVADQASANSNGSFNRLNYSIKRLQRMTATDTVELALSGQLSSKNLNTSEKLYLGGINSIRAYPQGEAGGDEGYLVNLELRHDYTATLQAMLFYDAGSVMTNRDSYIVGADNIRYLAGAGAGVNAMLAGIQIRASLAWRTCGGDPASEPSRRNPRLWLLAVKQF